LRAILGVKVVRMHQGQAGLCPVRARQGGVGGRIVRPGNGRRDQKSDYRQKETNSPSTDELLPLQNRHSPVVFGADRTAKGNRLAQILTKQDR